MTLCVVWEEGGTIKFATDSRMQLDLGEPDCATKLFRIPYKIRSSHSKVVLTEGDLGLAAAGFGLSAMIAKDTLLELLLTLETEEDPERYSMPALSNLIFMIFEKIMSAMFVASDHHLSFEIVWAGYCVVQKRYRTFCFQFNSGTPSLSEILLSGTTVKVFGNGAAPAIRIIGTASSGQIVLNAVQDVIDDPTWDSVGGAIQYGWFVGSKFQLASAAKIGKSTVRQRNLIDLAVDLAQEGFSSSFPLHSF